MVVDVGKTHLNASAERKSLRGAPAIDASAGNRD